MEDLCAQWLEGDRMRQVADMTANFDVSGIHKKRLPLLFPILAPLMAVDVRIPSTADIKSLIPIAASELRQGCRAFGRKVSLQVLSTDYGPGVFINCKGDQEIRLWSRMSYPFGRTATSLPAGTLLEVREPFLQKDAFGETAICIYHPTDLHFPPQWALVRSETEQVVDAEVAMEQFI
ncbi:hypothetical protein LTR95_016702, partial [Oleoguttula sp. CCFEE 5521]